MPPIRAVGAAGPLGLNRGCNPLLPGRKKEIGTMKLDRVVWRRGARFGTE